MKRKYWHNVGWFALGTFFGGWVLGAIGGIFGGIGKRG